MSAENLKGCCPHTRGHVVARKGVVDHSTKIPGGGSRDPIPLEPISAGTSHLTEGVSGSAVPIPPKVGPRPLYVFRFPADITCQFKIKIPKSVYWCKKYQWTCSSLECDKKLKKDD